MAIAAVGISLLALFLVVAIVLVLVLVPPWSPLYSEDKNVNRYQAVRMTPNGSVVCAFDNSTATHVGLATELCSDECSKNDNCLYYNYRTPTNESAVCQLYHFHPQRVAAQEDCVLFAVSQYSSCFINRLDYTLRQDESMSFLASY